MVRSPEIQEVEKLRKDPVGVERTHISPRVTGLCSLESERDTSRDLYTV